MVVLLGMIINVINNFDVDFIMPISKIDLNIETAHIRDSYCKEKFWFKINVLPKPGNYKTNSLSESDW